MKSRKWLLLLILLALASPTLAQTRVRVGVIRALGTASPYVAQEMGYHNHPDLRVELITFPDGPTMMQSFAAGQLDLAYGGLVPAGIWYNNGIDLKIVASTNSGGHLILVRQGSGIQSISQLRGKKVATPSTGSGTDVLFRTLILGELGGLQPRQVQIIPGIAPSDMPAMLAITKEVDAIITWEPFAAQALQSYGQVEVLLDLSAYWKGENQGESYPVNVVMASQAFIKTQPQALRTYLGIHRQTVDFINNNPDEANQVLSKILHLPVEVIADARTRTEFTYSINTEGIFRTLGYTRDLGYIRVLPKPQELIDGDYL